MIQIHESASPKQACRSDKNVELLEWMVLKLKIKNWAYYLKLKLCAFARMLFYCIATSDQNVDILTLL